MCGRPSARTVVIQNSSACSSARRVCSHPVAAAAGSLNRGSRVVTGVVTVLPLSGCPSVAGRRLSGGPLASSDGPGPRYSSPGAADGEQGGGSQAGQPRAFPGEVRLVGVSHPGRGQGQVGP